MSSDPSPGCQRVVLLVVAILLGLGILAFLSWP